MLYRICFKYCMLIFIHFWRKLVCWELFKVLGSSHCPVWSTGQWLLPKTLDSSQQTNFRQKWIKISIQYSKHILYNISEYHNFFKKVHMLGPGLDYPGKKKVIIHYYLRLLWSSHSSTHCDSGHNVSKWDMSPSFWLMRLWISKQNLNAFSSLSQDVLLWAKSKCFHLFLGLENAEKKIYKLG